METRSISSGGQNSTQLWSEEPPAFSSAAQGGSESPSASAGAQGASSASRAPAAEEQESQEGCMPELITAAASCAKAVRTKVSPSDWAICAGATGSAVKCLTKQFDSNPKTPASE